MKNLDNILNIAPDVKEEKLPSIINVESKTEASDDFTYARDNLYDVINKGQDALEEMLEVAKQSQHPRAYEVFATLMNTMLAANKDLVEMQKKKKEFFVKEEEKMAQSVTNNLFVGSTAELQKCIADRKKEDAFAKIVKNELIKY
jgi:hypothetical protein